ncbi:Class E vacuolar protein-sorting machinery protein hse-1 [Taphrina deformans PYCC 5710]|uniref:Class E vacuolar protein-sorting machinery protein HSE1 n=1 Tax=Taphrina deformans (strain PYCC 5710 / ATCC 11124 / CBS 356.35 / IMI 108563 / JCM 9778 / NBRC 8474) TaxID=1097556 RepID=R4X9E8_TAPDE|nr:Class E vacuolar protein-sorting machinery protein hse-1 [Taphrina deformans PYCC 5710]|eukprot:CCG82045.1 Class E vacuolar protein-sorting machinery protein hse-1 [Taphrina deformans PYCC 5710]
MFSRTAINPMDEPVTRATDENLTSENWELILGVCDRVDADPENGARNAVLAIQKRLGHRNANVQLFSLSLAEAVSKNCGTKAHREIASRSFIQALMRLINDKAIHAKVKARTAELVKQWTDDFSRDPSLSIMRETYNSIRAQGISVAPPPSRPQKKEITEADRRREEEELQIALAMSLNETKITQNSANTRMTNGNNRTEVEAISNAYTLPQSNISTDRGYALPSASSGSHQNATPQVQQTPIADRTAATVSRVRALYDFSASEAGELSFRRGDVIQVIESAYKDWWRGSLHGSIGIFPTNYVENLADPTPEDLRRESEDEQRIFAEAKNVEKLLSILSSAEPNDPRFAENDQLQSLYHSTISIRPKLVRLIEKYAQKKDDLILLNEKFLKARRDYDDLMEASLARYSSAPYPPRTGPDPRHAAYQQSMSSGGYQGHQVLQPQGDYRQYQQGPGAVRQNVASPADQYQYRSTPSQPGLFANQPLTGPQRSAAQVLQSSDSGYSNSYGPASGADPRQSTGYRDDRRVPSQMGPSFGPQTQSGGAPREANSTNHNNQQRSDSYPPPQMPTSPSQELAQAFPQAPPQTYRTSSYDHERAEREGGPPIAYYTEHDDDPGQDKGAAQRGIGYDSALSPSAPSAPGYTEEQADDGFADYYRRSGQ